MEKAGIAQWAILYAKVLDIAALSPWQRFGIDRPVSLRFPGRERADYAVFAAVDDCLILNFCLGDDALLDYQALRDAPPEEADELLYRQRFLSARLGEQPGMTGEDLELTARMAPAFPWEGRKLWFRSFEPGYAPSFPSRREVALLTDLTDQLYQALKDYFADEGAFSAPAAMLSRRYEADAARWLTSAERIVPRPTAPEALLCRDELFPARVRNRPLVDAKLELDAFYLPELIPEEESGKLFYPRVLVLADGKSGLIAAYETVSPRESLQEKLLALFTAFFERYGRPLVIYMQNPTLCAVLGDFLDSLYLPWRQVAFLPAVNSFKLTKGISRLSADDSGEER